MGNELLTGFLAGQSDGNGNNGNNGGESSVTYVPYPAAGFGGFGGGSPAESILQRSLDTQTIIGKLDGLSNGLCDGFYAQSNAINGLGVNVMQGFSQAELAESQRQAALMQQLSALGYQQKDCCCETQRAIDGVKYQMATDTCNIIQSTHNDTDRIIARLDAIESSRKDQKIAEQAAEIQAYKQNATFGAMLDASRAEILRRTGAECPSAAYIVQPPQPVSFATNCSGQAVFNNGWNNGCGNGCGSCC